MEEEAKEYTEWCLAKGYKKNDTEALKEYNELKRTGIIKFKMSLYGDDISSLANYLGMARQTLSKKLNGEADFTQTEMSLIKIKYNLTDEEFTQLFAKEICQDEHSRSSEEVK